MAGDWIKVQHVTADKPEVVKLAHILGIDQDAAFGKCIRLWIWADQQSIDGNAISVTKAFIDRYTCNAGFADALENVRWLYEKDGLFYFPHFDRHNGESSKKRALTQNRVEKHRNLSNVQGVTVALPEKRREEYKSKTLDNCTTQEGEVVLPWELPWEPPDTGGKPPSPLQGIEIEFEFARKEYPGTRRGHDVEWMNFKRKFTKQLAQVVPLLRPAIQRYVEQIKANKTEKKYIAHFQTWVNQQRWTVEYQGNVQGNSENSAPKNYDPLNP